MWNNPINTHKHAVYFLVYALILCTVLIGASRLYIHTQNCAEAEKLLSSMYAGAQKNLSENIQAGALYVYDFTDKKIIAQKNKNTALPLASLSKILTVRMVLADLDPHTTYQIQQKDLDRAGESGFVLGQTYRIDELMTAALVPSSNDSAAALMHALGYMREQFAQQATKEAHDLGFTSFAFQNPTGLDMPDGSASNIGSAEDVTGLLYETWKKYPEVIERSNQKIVSIESTDGHVITYTNTDTLISEIPLLIASKTGYTLSAGGNLSILWRTPHEHILGATLLGSSVDGRFSDMRRLITITSAIIENEHTLSQTLCKN